MITVKVRVFARLREAITTPELNVSIVAGASIADLQRHLMRLDSQWQVLEQGSVLVALNHQHCELGESLSDGDEVAFFPPVTGG